LTALGAPRETVHEDYLLTGRFLEQSYEMILNDTHLALFAKVDRAIWESLMRVHPDYMDAMFEQLIESHGSVEEYLRDCLAMDRMSIEQLRSNLLD
jgi:protein-tyrosine phosphatase